MADGEKRGETNMVEERRTHCRKKKTSRYAEKSQHTLVEEEEEEHGLKKHAKFCRSSEVSSNISASICYHGLKEFPSICHRDFSAAIKMRS